MGFRVTHEQFSLEKAHFAMPGAVMGEDCNPLESRGTALVAEIARTGWDLPGIDVEIDTHGKGKDVLRRVWTVSFATARGDMRLFFGNRQRDGSYGLSGADLGGKPLARFYDDGSGSRAPEDVAFVIEAIDEVTQRLRKVASMPGHDDVTEEGDAVLRRLCHVEPIPVPEGFPVLYAWAERDDAWRLAGHGDDAGTPAADYGLPGNGWRLSSLGAGSGNPLHFNGYTYASDDPAKRASQVIHTARDECLPVEIRLRWLNDVYVVDNAAFRNAIEAAWKKAEAEGRDRITDRELDECTLATARTIVPWKEYRGGFGDPVVLIGRQTARDEVRLMKGPVTVTMDADSASATMRDEQTGLEMELSRVDGAGIGALQHVMRIARDARSALGVQVKASREVQERIEAGRKHQDTMLSSLGI